MKKEVILAIAIGFALGLVITFGIWTANKSLKDIKAAKPTPTSSPIELSPTPAISTTESSLILNSPTDELLTDKDTVTVSGKTAPKAAVVILSEGAQQVITSDNSGSFSADITLEGGYNTITVTSFDPDGKSDTVTLTVTYTTAKV